MKIADLDRLRDLYLSKSVPSTLDHHDNCWFARGCVLITDIPIDHDNINIAVALGIVDEIMNWNCGIIPAIYVPDRVTECPSNVHHRVVIAMQVVFHLVFRVAHIVIENGTAIYLANNSGTKATIVIEVDLSDPHFMETILQSLAAYRVLPTCG